MRPGRSYREGDFDHVRLHDFPKIVLKHHLGKVDNEVIKIGKVRISRRIGAQAHEFLVPPLIETHEPPYGVLDQVEGQGFEGRI